MLFVSKLLGAIVDLIESAFIKMTKGLDALEHLIVRFPSPAPPPAAASPATAATHEQSESTHGILSSDSILLGTTPATCECDSDHHDGEQHRHHLRMAQLTTENALLTRKQEHLQRMIMDLSEYALRLERDVEFGDATTTRLTRELHLHKHLASSALAMYHSAKHQLAAAELRQSVALDYIDELVVKYGCQTRYSYDEGGDDSSDTDSALNSLCSTVAAYDDDDDVFRLEELE